MQTVLPTYPNEQDLILFLKKNGQFADWAEEETESKEEDLPKKDYILCRQCRHKITHPDYIISVQEKHKHVFFNPQGIVFEIGCYAKAQGCTQVGTPTYEFTWFSGFAWSIALCSNCFEHLGWHYQDKETNNFYGLILARLIHESE